MLLAETIPFLTKIYALACHPITKSKPACKLPVGFAFTIVSKTSVCLRAGHGVVVGIGVDSWSHPIPSKVNSFTTAPSKRATTFAGKVTRGGIVHVSREGFVGFTEQVVSLSAISTVRVLSVKSGGGSTIRKLIRLIPVSHIVTLPESTGG